MTPLENLSLQQLTTKLAILLALVTAHRKQTLISIKRSNIRKVTDGYEIEIPERVKTSRSGVYQPLLVIPRFEEKPNLCVASVLERYLEVTSSLAKDFDNLREFEQMDKGVSSGMRRWSRIFTPQRQARSNFVGLS